jgi:hypothetical protein
VNPPARTIGRYEIRRELGHGSMGVVYAAHDPVLGRDIALKVIQLGLGIQREELEKFEQRFFVEARTAARLSHPGIVVVHDVGRDAASGALFMALELLKGETLEHALRENGPLPWREALRLAQRLAEALSHAHALGVVHRDIKPANVMLLASGEPKIMDFGIAKLDASQLTATGQFLGTPLYMSPEQAQAHPVDGRSDLFSLGSVLYEALTGRRAFGGESVTQILLRIVSREPEAPSRLAPGLPAGVDALLARCLAKDAAQRYPDGRALAADIEDVLADRSPRGLVTWTPPGAATATLVAAVARETVALPAPPTQAPPVAQREAPRRDRRLVIAASAVLLLGALAFLVWNEPVARRVEPVTADAPRPIPTQAAPAPTGPARLTVEFEHSLKSGVLRVWVDDHAVIQESFGGRVTRRLGGLEMRKGRLSGVLEVSPGRREVRVQVAWDDDVKTASAWATFKPGAMLRLKARLGSLGGLRKDLTLDWD